MTARRLLLRAAAAAASVAGLAGAAAAPVAAQAQQWDWTRTVAATPEGGWRMGNPEAAVRVVEFVSLTCPHCRAFANHGAPELVRDHVAGGRLSFEIRPFPLDPVAAVGAQLTSCAAPDHAFALNDDILAGQDVTFARLDALSREDVAALAVLPPAELRVQIAAAAGYDAIAARHGLDAARLRACLADEAGAARIEAIKAEAERLGVGGTPSFLVDGGLAEGVHDWTGLAPLLARR